MVRLAAAGSSEVCTRVAAVVPVWAVETAPTRSRLPGNDQVVPVLAPVRGLRVSSDRLLPLRYATDYSN